MFTADGFDSGGRETLKIIMFPHHTTEKKMITKLLICIKKLWPKHKSMNAKITSLSNLKTVTQSYVARWSEGERMSHFNLFSRQILLYDTNNLS